MSFRMLVLLLCVTAMATEPILGTLRGHVVDPYGGAATETQVRVVQWYFVDGEPRTTFDKDVYTNRTGDFSVRVPPGVYDVFVSRVDSEPIARKMKIVPQKETSFNPRLKGSSVTQLIE